MSGVDTTAIFGASPYNIVGGCPLPSTIAGGIEPTEPVVGGSLGSVWNEYNNASLSGQPTSTRLKLKVLIEVVIMICAVLLIFTVMYPNNEVANGFSQFAAVNLLMSTIALIILDVTGDDQTGLMVAGFVAIGGGIGGSVLATWLADKAD